MIELTDIVIIGAILFLGILVGAGSYTIWNMAKKSIAKSIHDAIEEALEESGKEIKYTFKDKKEKDT